MASCIGLPTGAALRGAFLGALGAAFMGTALAPGFGRHW
jgi:hypothetical protein